MQDVVYDVVDGVKKDNSKYSYYVKENVSKKEKNIISYGISIRDEKTRLSKAVNVICITDIKHEKANIIIQDGVKLAPTVLYNNTDYYENIKDEFGKYLDQILRKSVILLEKNINLQKIDKQRVEKINELISK